MRRSPSSCGNEISGRRARAAASWRLTANTAESSALVSPQFFHHPPLSNLFILRSFTALMIPIRAVWIALLADRLYKVAVALVGGVAGTTASLLSVFCKLSDAPAILS